MRCKNIFKTFPLKIKHSSEKGVSVKNSRGLPDGQHIRQRFPTAPELDQYPIGLHLF